MGLDGRSQRELFLGEWGIQGLFDLFPPGEVKLQLSLSKLEWIGALTRHISRISADAVAVSAHVKREWGAA